VYFLFVLLSEGTNACIAVVEGRCVRDHLEIAGLVFMMARILLLCFGLSRRWGEKSLQAESNEISNLVLL